jgi:PAB-dependent poly(A)-specific ribonuclease subunit 2
MPYYREQLLSAWPSHLIFEIGAPPAKVDPRLLASLKSTEWGGYGPNISNTRRNQVQNTRTTEKTSTTIQAPKFLSEKSKASANDASIERRISDVADAISATELSSLKAEVPVMYRNVEIKYSKFGVDDFDFGLVHTPPYSCLVSCFD